MSARANAKHASKSGKRASKRHATTPTRQPRVIGQRRSNRGTGLLADADAAVIAEAEYYGVSVRYVIACCVLIALEVESDPALMYEAMQRRQTRRNLRVVRGGRT